MKTPDFQEGDFVRYVVEGPILALVETDEGVGIVLRIIGPEATVVSGSRLDLIQRGPDPRDAEIKRLRKELTAKVFENVELFDRIAMLESGAER